MKKKVLITGAGDGIGLACVGVFLKNNWQVVAHYHSSSTHLEKIQKAVGKENIIFLKADFSQKAQINNFLKTIKTLNVDALVNNAALYDMSTTQKDRLKAIEDVLLVNTIVPTLIAETVLATMKVKKSGAIVNVSSVGVKYGSGLKNIFYGASKAGLETVSKSLAREGAAYNILVNTVRPGITDTAFHQKAGKDMKERVKLIPLKRMAKPEEIARQIYFLCAENTFITNEILTVAGGE